MILTEKWKLINTSPILTATPNDSPIPRNAPPGWKWPTYRPVPHLSFLKGSYSHLFQTRTRWIAQRLAEGAHIPKQLLFTLLQTRRIPPETLALWVEILNKRDPIFALERLGLLESASAADEIRPSKLLDSTKPPCPDWLYLSLPAMVTNHQQVPYLASQLLSNRFSALDERSRSIFLSRCIQHFIKVRHYVALRETIEFIAFTRPDGSGGTVVDKERSIWREGSFGRILEALGSERIRSGRKTSAPRELIHSLRDLVLATMKQRQVPRTSLVTYLPLFSPTLIPSEPKQAIKLMVEMTSAGFEPKRQVLHQVMKVLVRKGGMGDREAADKIKEEIERRREGKAVEWEDRKASRSGDNVPLHLREVRGIIVEGTIEEAMLEGTKGVGGSEQESSDIVVDSSATSSRSPPTSSQLNVIDSTSEVALTSSSPPTLRRYRPSTRRTPSSRSRRSVIAPSPSSNDVYSTTQLFDRSISLAYFAQLRHYLSTNTNRRGLGFPEPPFPSSPVAWAALFQSVVHETSAIDHQFLITLLKKLDSVNELSGHSHLSPPTSYIPSRPSLRLRTIVMHSLLIRNQPRQLLGIFKSIEARGIPIDATVFDLFVRAMCQLNGERKALQTLLHYEHLPSLHDPTLLVSLRSSPSPLTPRRPNSVRLDIVPFNSLLSHYSRVSKYQEVYSMFKSLEEEHEVRPDIATISILLDSARYASTAAGRGWGLELEEMGAGTMLGGRSRSNQGRNVKQRAEQSVVDDKWDGIAAAKRIEKLVWEEILGGNWQEMELENPLEGRGGVSGWLSNRFSSNRSGSSSFAERVEPLPNWRPFVSTLSPLPPLYPDIYPTDPFLRSLVLLTGVHSSIPLIGRILAWARYSNVRPSRYTLCLALLYIEGDAGIKKDRIDKLRKWLEAWLGEGSVPDQEEIAWMRRGGRVKGTPEVR